MIPFFRVLVGVVLLAGLIFGLSTLLSSINQQPAREASPNPSLISVLQETNITDTPPKPTQEESPYPPPPSPSPVLTEAPTPTAPVTPAPTEPSSLPLFPPLPENVKAITLHNGHIWLQEAKGEPIQLTNFGDIAVIFGWNYDGTKILFGKGRVEQGHLVGDTTELWFLEVSSGQTQPLTTTNAVKTASWSPVDDRIAYCELGDTLTIIDLSGKSLNQMEQAICDFTWDPDGSAIAIPTYTPEMVDVDGLKYTVLAIWWLNDNWLQVFSNAKDENHSFPIWSVDGKHILFHRTYHAANPSGQDGLYVVDVLSSQFLYLEGTTFHAREISRSYQDDLIVYQSRDEVIVIDFFGNINFTAQGSNPLWLPDGSLLYLVDSTFQIIFIDIETTSLINGGRFKSPGLYFQPEFLFSSQEEIK